MPKKKRVQTQADTTQAASADTTSEPTVATVELPERPPIERPAYLDGPTTTESGPSTPANDEDAGQEQAQPKNWGDPYKSVFSCPEQGFELGEHRRFRQRVFRFAEKPREDIVAALKEKGFTYRASEKAWTIPANPDSRKMTDELAREWAGPNYIKSVER